MSKGGALDAILNFCRRELPEAVMSLAAKHTAAATARTGLATAEVVSRLGPEVNAMIFTCVAEDLLSQPAGPEGMCVADYFLKRHGWKITSQEREQIRMIRDSSMGLYEATAIRAGMELVLRDVLLEGPDISVYKPGISQSLPIGSVLCARLINFDDVTIFSAGILPLEDKLQTEAVAYVRAAAEIGDRPFEPADMAKLAPHFTNFWLLKSLAEQGVPVSEPG